MMVYSMFIKQSIIIYNNNNNNTLDVMLITRLCREREDIKKIKLKTKIRTKKNKC